MGENYEGEDGTSCDVRSAKDPSRDHESHELRLLDSSRLYYSPIDGLRYGMECDGKVERARKADMARIPSLESTTDPGADTTNNQL